jgi:hypothetical protein
MDLAPARTRFPAPEVFRREAHDITIWVNDACREAGHGITPDHENVTFLRHITSI